MIVSTDPDLNYFVFQQEGHSFQSWYPDTFTEIFGRQNVGSLHGFMYKYLKHMVLNLFGPVSLQKMLPEVENTALKKLRQWSWREMIEVKDETANVIIQFLDCPFFVLELLESSGHQLTDSWHFADDIRSDSKEAAQLRSRQVPG